MTDTNLPIFLYSSTPSTNDLALESALTDAPHGACWVADEQTAGRGRRETGGQRRTWHSPGGANLYMSILLRPALDPTRAAALTLAAGLGICETLRGHTGVDVWLKWPNDLFVASRKLGGILTEATTVPDGTLAVVIGVGINVNLTRDQIPEELRQVMTTLHLQTGTVHDRLALIPPIRDAVLARCDELALEGLDALLPALREHDRSAGRRISMQQNGRTRYGTARGIGPHGQLVVELDSGDILDVMAGEVRFE